ncbi:MAG TPA: sialidase family protein [Solirubrobacteraceae bacterium]|nr:sialidase family protein [Solirubrobacteraceae bacterium]
MRRPLSLACSTLALLALPSVTPAAADPGCNRSWPVLTYRAGPDASQPETAPLPIACGIATGYAASETTVAVSNSGALFFSPANSENTLARSRDRAATWSLLAPPKLQYTSLWNTVDPEVVVDRQTGRVFWVHTTYTEDLRSPLPDQTAAAWLAPTAIANAHGFQVYSTGDDGGSWTTADYQHENTTDWEKIFLGPPPPPSTGAAQPVRYPNVVYVCANAPQEVIGPGRACYKSLDGGVTFTATGYEFPSASAPSGCPALAANGGVVGTDGTVYIPQSCNGGTYLAVSHDEAATYAWLPVTGAPPASGLGAVVQLAIDQANNLYLLWTTGDALRLVSSRDGGRSWSAPLTVSPPGLHTITLPGLAAGPRAAVGIVYYASSNPSAKMLSGYISQTADALAPRPLFSAGEINDPAHPIFQNYGNAYSPRADFVGGAYDADGGFWGGIVGQLGPPDTSNAIPTTGYVGHLALAPAASGTNGPGRSSAPIAVCRSRRNLTIVLPRPRHARITTASVFVDGVPLVRIHGHRVRRVVIPARSAPSFTVTVVATTSKRGRRVIVRRYHGCAR